MVGTMSGTETEQEDSRAYYPEEAHGLMGRMDENHPGQQIKINK